MKQKISKEELLALAVSIIDVFDDFLNEHGIYLENPEKTGDKEEANIYGSQYYALEDRILDVLIRELDLDTGSPQVEIKENEQEPQKTSKNEI